MMLEGNFYTVLSPVMEDDRIQAVLQINPGHEIFQGHFPGQPVVPGVCMMQIVKELVQKTTGRPVQLRHGLDLKFLSVIDPGKNNTVHAEANYTVLASGDINVTARLFFNEITFFKFKGVFTEADL
ncbi:MAG: 3-hydroxyacyl-ACP dehydratase [Chitinophagaceae bacterium]